MAIAVARAHRDERHAGRHGTQELGRRARGTPVVSHLEHVRVKIPALVRQEPVLFATLGVAHEQHAHPAYAHEHDGARFVGVAQP